MKKLISSIPFVLGILLGYISMSFAIQGKLHTTAAAEIFVFSLGFMITVFSTYAAFKTIK